MGKVLNHRQTSYYFAHAMVVRVLGAAEGTVMMIRFAVIFIGFRFGEM